jgi:hypothetical protein
MSRFMTLLAGSAVLVALLPLMPFPAAAQTTETAPKAQAPAEITFGYAIDDMGKIKQVVVYRQGKQVQTLDSCTGSDVPYAKGVGDLAQEDFNFDGYLDLMMRVEHDSRLDNSKYCVWLFDPKSQTYALSEELSRLTNPQPVSSDKTVVARRNQLCAGRCYTQTTYKWWHGPLEPIREESLTEDPMVPPESSCRFIQSVKVEKKGVLAETLRQRVDPGGVMCEPHTAW